MRSGASSRLRFFLCGLLGLGLATGARADLGVPISKPRPVSVNDGPERVSNDRPDLGTDGQGLWIAVWSSITVPTANVEHDILFARSVNSGENWSVPALLAADAATDFRDERNANIATDGHGNWVVVWSSQPPRNPDGGSDSDILTCRSSDNGANWSSVIALNTNAAFDDGDDFAPAIATDRNGVWIATWMSNSGIAGTGSDRDILFARSTDNGATWTAPLPLNTNATTDSLLDEYPRIATDRRGHWIAVWTATAGFDDPPDCMFATSANNGTVWSPPRFLNVNGATAAGDYGPVIANDEEGRWVAAWESNDSLGGTIGSDLDILVTRSNTAGAIWSPQVALNAHAATDTRDDIMVQLAADRRRNWVAVWSTEENLNGIGIERDLLVARSSDAGATWSTATPLNTDAATDSNEDSLPRIVTDLRGEWVTVWSSLELPGSATGDDTELLAAHFGFPDCNGNLIGDPLEIAAGISPDVNGDNIPDSCDAVGSPGGCGGGMCGTGSAAFAPALLLSASLLRRSARRNRKEKPRA